MSPESKIKVYFYANLRQALGQKSVEIVFTGPANVGDMIREITREFPVLAPDLLGDTGGLHTHLNFLFNGRDMRHLEGHLDTLLAECDQLSLVPALSGGT